MTAIDHRATRRAVIAAYIAAWVLLLWTDADEDGDDW